MPKETARQISYETHIETRGSLAEGVAAAAVDYLKRAPSQPFFLDVGFAETHLLKVPGKSRFGHPRGDPRTAEIPVTLADTPPTRHDMADYAVSVRALDEQIGRIFEALERYDLAQETLVICTTDHGIPLPGIKANHTDGGLGVMLMMRGPGGFSGGKVQDALVSQMDIFPTLCELLDLEPPAWLQGTSLLPLIRGETARINDAVFAEYVEHAAREPQASVRTERYRYGRRLDGSRKVVPANTDNTLTKELWLENGWADRPVAAEGLYDLLFDPHERSNLVENSSYEDVLGEMRERLVTRMEGTDNPLLPHYNVTVGPPAQNT